MSLESLPGSHKVVRGLVAANWNSSPMSTESLASPETELRLLERTTKHLPSIRHQNNSI